MGTGENTMKILFYYIKFRIFTEKSPNSKNAKNY